jgi:hypothetical protein
MIGIRAQTGQPPRKAHTPPHGERRGGDAGICWKRVNQQKPIIPRRGIFSVKLLQHLTIVGALCNSALTKPARGSSSTYPKGAERLTVGAGSGHNRRAISGMISPPADPRTLWDSQPGRGSLLGFRPGCFEPCRFLHATAGRRAVSALSTSR